MFFLLRVARVSLLAGSILLTYGGQSITAEKQCSSYLGWLECHSVKAVFFLTYGGQSLTAEKQCFSYLGWPESHGGEAVFFLIRVARVSILRGSILLFSVVRVSRPKFSILLT